MPESQNIEWKESWRDEYFKENKSTTNEVHQEIFKVSKATATRDLTELIEKFKLLE